MGLAPTIRATAGNSLPVHQAGDVLLVFTTATASSDWTLLANANPSKVYYKMATSSSMSAGTISSAIVASIAGASKINASGSTPGFLGGAGAIAGGTGPGGNGFAIPTYAPASMPAIQLSFVSGTAGGGNPWFVGVGGGYSSGLTALQTDYYTFFGYSDGTSAQSVTWGYYGGVNSGLVTVKIVPNLGGFFAMF